MINNLSLGSVNLGACRKTIARLVEIERSLLKKRAAHTHREDLEHLLFPIKGLVNYSSDFLPLCIVLRFCVLGDTRPDLLTNL